jgi:hypothetical protein
LYIYIEMGRTDKMRKSSEKHKDQLISEHPCSYQYLQSSGTVSEGNPVKKVIDYADQEDMSYKISVSTLAGVSEKRRTASIGDLPSITDHELDFVNKMIELDEMRSKGRPSRISIKNNLKIAYTRGKGTPGYKKIQGLKQAMIEVGLVMAGKRPGSSPDISSVSEDMRESILISVSEEDRIQTVEDKDDKDDETGLLDTDDKDSDSDDTSFIETRGIWGSDDEFAVWMYAQMIGRNDVAEAITQDNNPNVLNVSSDLNDLTDMSSTLSDLEQNIDRNENIDLTPQQREKFSRVQDIVSDPNKDQNESVVEVVNEMTRLEMSYNSSSDSDTDDIIINSDESDEESWINESIDQNTSPEDIPSILQSELEN